MPAPIRAWDWAFTLDVLRHAVLPALSIVLVSVGGWALAMRGMMVTTMGEDYVTFAEAKGLRSATIFTRYCMRNAILPQTTGLALALGPDPVGCGTGRGNLRLPGDRRVAVSGHRGK